MKNDERGKKQGTTQESPTALRLLFTYEGDKVTLLSKKKVRMISPPSDSLDYDERASGFWYEVRDAKGKALYRRVTQNPIQYAAEVRTGDPEMPLKWERADKPKGQFVLFIPMLDKADQVSLFSSPLDIKKRLEPARKLVSFSLGKTDGGKEAK